MEKDKEIEELLNKEIPVSEITASNEERELSELTTNDPYKNICVSCEG
jgi:hypothetical protein